MNVVSQRQSKSQTVKTEALDVSWLSAITAKVEGSPGRYIEMSPHPHPHPPSIHDTSSEGQMEANAEMEKEKEGKKIK